ncbi:cytochrome P450 [Streptomyces sp. NBC_00102]|uniref:cytochrome P450 family protein n=1 Tax=Streptomyces sp. NBC_00102 TaxID=2975652 RepID=UPI002252FE6F|nr:cytochrome P450 [Streptomyces sp. NBC_00102]MCX5395502.1 cytochrome P450 [Streptomyces sp. NBC_00102]
MQMELELAEILYATDREAAFEELRRGPRVRSARYLDGTPLHIVTGHAEISTVLTDPRFSIDPNKQTRLDVESATGLPPDVQNYLLYTLGTSDPPDHTRLRRLVSRGFTPRRVNALRPRVQRITDLLVDGLAAGDSEVDLIEDFTHPLSLQVICELLGVPTEDHGHWEVWAKGMATPQRAVVVDSARGLIRYISDLIETKRKDGGDDLLSELITVRDDGSGRLSDEELVALSLSILLAGLETTSGLVSEGMYHLLRRPESAAALRADPTLIPQAVEEFLRYCGPVDVGMLRFTLEPVELGGVMLPAGEPVQVVYGAGNRDVLRFAEPNTPDLKRTDNPHLAFGHGIHYCLGAALARLEAHVAFESVLRRLPRMELAAPDEAPGWLPGVGRALASLRVRPNGSAC